jgi:hypothetical protein
MLHHGLFLPIVAPTTPATAKSLIRLRFCASEESLSSPIAVFGRVPYTPASVGSPTPVLRSGSLHTSLSQDREAIYHEITGRAPTPASVGSPTPLLRLGPLHHCFGRVPCTPAPRPGRLGRDGRAATRAMLASILICRRAARWSEAGGWALAPAHWTE